MVLLGCDPGYRHFGLVLVETSGEEKPRVLKRTTLKNGSIKQWQHGLISLLRQLDEFLLFTPRPDLIGIEMISWYGKRKGSLQLAHLAGACAGFLHTRTTDQYPKFFSPKQVKAISASYKPPKGFDEHQHDALSICRLLASQ